MLYQDRGGNPVTVERFEQAIEGMRLVEATLRPGEVRPFYYRINNKGYAHEPFSQALYDTITDQSAHFPQSAEADIVIGITTRELLKKRQHLKLVDGVADMYDRVSVLTSHTKGTMLLSTLDIATGGTQSANDVMHHSAYGGYQLITGERSCKRSNCLANTAIEGAIPNSSSPGLLLGLLRKTPRVSWTFCNDTEEIIRKSFPRFVREARFRAMNAPDDLA